MSDPDETIPHPQPLPGDSNDEYERMLSQHGLGQEPLQREQPRRASTPTATPEPGVVPDEPKPPRPTEFILGTASYERALAPAIRVKPQAR